LRKKRNVLTKSRREILARPGVVYTIRCTGNACDCQLFGVDCRRGFFSLWIQAVYGIYLAQKLNIRSYVDFGDKPYLYSDPERYHSSLNFWNYYYLQESIPGGRAVPNNYEENYPLRIWKRNHFRAVHRSVINKLELRPEINEYIQALLSKFKGLRTLGVHVRQTDHAQEVPAVPMDQYYRVINKCIKHYEKIFLATDDQKTLESFMEEFGSERLVFQPAVRSINGQAVHTDLQHSDRYRLGLEVLADCYALAACHKAVLVHSNVSYGSLIINPELSYTLLETKHSFRNRWKTGLLYTLDNWGIRKM